jgi:hypothetical protein
MTCCQTKLERKTLKGKESMSMNIIARIEDETTRCSSRHNLGLELVMHNI